MKSLTSVSRVLWFASLVVSLTLTPILFARASPWASADRVKPFAPSPCTAGQEAPAATGGSVTVNITCDNDFALYAGDCCSVTQAGFIGSNSCSTNMCIRDGKTFTISGLTGSSYIYVVAWSDAAVGQGLLASIQGTSNMVLTGDSRWQVFPTNSTASSPSNLSYSAACTFANKAGVPFAPGSKKFTKCVNMELSQACSNNFWTTPSVGGTGASGNLVPSGSGNPLEPPPDLTPLLPASWIWYQDNKSACAGPDSPFSPGCNHDEFLIFRVPASYALP